MIELDFSAEIAALQQERYRHTLAEIARLTARVARLRSQHRRTVEPLKELCEWRAKQIMFELNAPAV